MHEVIARRELIAVTHSGERLPVTIEVGKPVSSPDPDENWECHLSITPPLMMYADSDDEFTLDDTFPEVGRHPGHK